jgi:hypothetical protein
MMATENSRAQVYSVSGDVCGYSTLSSLKNACYPVFFGYSGIKPSPGKNPMLGIPGGIGKVGLA